MLQGIIRQAHSHDGGTSPKQFFRTPVHVNTWINASQGTERTNDQVGNQVLEVSRHVLKSSEHQHDIMRYSRSGSFGQNRTGTSGAAPSVPCVFPRSPAGSAALNPRRQGGDLSARATYESMADQPAQVNLTQGMQFDTSLALRARVLSLYSLDTNTDQVTTAVQLLNTVQQSIFELGQRWSAYAGARRPLHCCVAWGFERGSWCGRLSTTTGGKGGEG